MAHKTTAALALTAALLTGCASDPSCIPDPIAGCAYNPAAARQARPAAGPSYQPLVDYHAAGYDHTKYLADSRECNALAAQRSVGQSAADGAVGGLMVGALLGGLVGAAYDDPGYGATYGAALGTATGAVRGAADGANTQKGIVRECMLGRGYRVLD